MGVYNTTTITSTNFEQRVTSLTNYLNNLNGVSAVESTSEYDSKEYSGAFMVGNRVVEFHYNMYAEVPDQDLGDTFFNQIMDSIEYSKDFK